MFYLVRVILKANKELIGIKDNSLKLNTSLFFLCVSYIQVLVVYGDIF